MACSHPLKDKIALITGGAQGIGEAIARQFVEDGAGVVIGDINVNAGDLLAHDLGTAAQFYSLDVSNESSYAKVIETIIARHGRLDILVNNAGIVVPIKPIHETSSDEFNRLIDVNLRGVFLGCKLAYPHLIKTRGCVLNISSLVGIVGEKSHAIYGATKGAINALTLCTAADWRRNQVRINALCPGDVWTGALECWCREMGDETARRYQQLRADGFCANPNEIGSIASFLCSDASRFINGAIIPASFAAECGYSL